jgi:hypothetical protein
MERPGSLYWRQEGDGKGARVVHYYRLYLFDSRGAAASLTEFECGSDHDAEEIAERRFRGIPMELWEQDRLVRTFPSEAA